MTKTTLLGVGVAIVERLRVMTMRVRFFLLAVAVVLQLTAGAARAQYGQYPMLDAAANRVIQKYQNSSCDQLWQDRNRQKSQEEQRAVQFLRSDPQMGSGAGREQIV